MSDMNDLVTFLLARLGEDEQVARAATGEAWGIHAGCEDGHDDWVPIQLAVSGDDVAESRGDYGLAYAEHIARYDPARVLAEVTVKRHIIDQYCEVRDEAPIGDRYTGQLEALEHVIRTMGPVHADHPDYRDEWNL